MDDYHRYLYDFKGGKIIGDYESAYKNCDDVHPCQHEVDTLKHRMVLDHFSRRGKAGEDQEILDMGCGYGVFVDRMTREGFKVRGCDVSPSAISSGLGRFPGLRLEVGDVANGLPYPDESFHGVIMFGVIWFLLDDLNGCLREISRVLKPGGDVFLSLGFPKNQTLGKETIADFDDLHRFVSARFQVLEMLAVYDRAAMARGEAPGDCERDCVIIARKD